MPLGKANPVNDQGIIRQYHTPKNFRGRSFSNDYFNPNVGIKRPFSTSEEDNSFKPYRLNRNHPIKRVQFNTNIQVDNEMGRNAQTVIKIIANKVTFQKRSPIIELDFLNLKDKLQIL